VGLIIGPLLAGILSARSPELPLYAGSALFFLTGLLITAASLLLPKIRIDRGVNGNSEKDTGRTDTSTIFRFSGWVGMVTSFVVIGVVVNIFPVYARDELLLRKETIGVLMQSRTFLSTFVFVILSQTHFWHFRISPMVAGQVCLGILVLSMGFTRSTLVLGVLISLIGCLRALSFSGSMFHGVSGSINRAGRMAIHESLLAFGLIVGSSLGGILYQQFSMKAVYAFCFAIVVTGAAVQLGLYLLLRDRKGHEIDPEA
jgi:DHA1 family multidrug resistance protein-like MFS transporter/DHA1 family quinolone resistance protein-like MFS transporter